MRKKYSRHGIEERLKNPLYWGYFYVVGNSARYEGKHEKIIPDETLKVVAAINSGNGCKRKTSVSPLDDIFRGWLYCGHSACQRLVTYEKKEKTLKSTGEAKVYHLYRCSNSRRIHDRKTYISEDKIWAQFAPVLENLVINEEFANDVRKALNEDYETQNGQAAANMESCKKTLKELDEKEDATYDDMKRGLLDETQYQRRIRRVRDERDECKERFERLRLLKKALRSVNCTLN